MRKSIYAHIPEGKRRLVIALESILLSHPELQERAHGPTSIRQSLETCDRRGNLCDWHGNPEKSP